MTRFSPPYSAQAIRAELGRQGLPKTALAEVLGISHISVYRRLTGETDFRAEEIIAIADFLNVPTSKLIKNTHPSEVA